MSQIKTAISIHQSIYQQMEKLSRDLKISRSRVYEMAAREFLKLSRDQQVTDQLNQVYANDADPEDDELLARLKPYYRKVLEK